MSVLAHGSGNDYVKYYSDVKDFQDVNKVLHGEEHKVDIMKTNEKYALNATHFGLDAVVAKTMNIIRRHSIFGGKNCYLSKHPLMRIWMDILVRCGMGFLHRHADKMHRIC